MKRAAAFLPVVALLAAATGCGTEARTQIMVVSDTDMPVPSVVDEIRFEVVAPDGTTKRARAPFTTATPPAILGLAHTDGPLGPYDITAIASVSGSDVVSRRARVSFVRERTMLLRLDLHASCVGMACGTEQTCDGSGCRSIDVPEGELLEWTGEAPRVDGAVPPGDAGSMDGASPTDGGVDGGGMDGGCTAAAQCDDSVACTVDSCAMGRCEHVPDDGVCAVGDTCDPMFGCGGRVCGGDPDCDDGLFCNGSETCVGGFCASSDPPCGDAVACTVDDCDEATDACSSSPDATLCDDGFACTTERCEAAGCTYTTDAMACVAGELCTTAAGCTPAPTFTDVFDGVLDADCGSCHTRGMPTGDLDFSSRDLAYAQLVGVTAVCGGGTNTRVIAYDAATSLLWRKIAGVDLCGARMPFGRTPLSDAQIDMVRDWINAGAADN